MVSRWHTFAVLRKRPELELVRPIDGAGLGSPVTGVAPAHGRHLRAPAALLVVSAATSAGLLTTSSGADVTFPLLAAALAALAAFVVLEHRRPAAPVWVVLGLATALHLLAVVEPPRGSQDLWSYATYGRMLVHYHLSPYSHRPRDLRTDPIAARVAPGWQAARSVYGPGFSALSAGVMALARTSALRTRLAFQGLAALATLVSGALLTRRRVGTAALAAILLNPIIVVSVVNGGHNDALVGLALLASALAIGRDRPVAGGLLLAAAVLTKAVAVLAVVPVLAWIWRRRGRPATTRAAAAVAGPVVAGYVVFGPVRALAPLLAADVRRSRTSLWGLVPSHPTGTVAAVAVLALTAVLVLPQLKRSIESVFVASMAGYLLAAPYLLPWYFAWILPLVGLDAGSIIGGVLLAQAVVVLVAYQHQSTNHPDLLDQILRSWVVGAQVLALAAVVALVVAGWRGRQRVAAPPVGEPVHPDPDRGPPTALRQANE